MNYCLERGDNEFELVIDYDINPYDPGRTSGPPEDCYPPEGGDVTDLRATLDGKPFELTSDEENKICAHIQQTHDHNEDDGGYLDYLDRG